MDVALHSTTELKIGKVKRYELGDGCVFFTREVIARNNRNEELKITFYAEKSQNLSYD